jgi:glyoxylase I family protein
LPFTIPTVGIQSERPAQIGLSHVGLSVADLDRSVRFYCDVLGAAMVQPPCGGFSEFFSGRMAILLLGAHALDLFQHADNDGDPFKPGRTGLDHLSMAVDSLDDLRAWAAWLDANDVPRSDIRDPLSVGGIFDFADPDGIQLEFFFLDQKKLRQSAPFSC